VGVGGNRIKESDGVERMWSQSNWLQAHVDAFDRIGGVPDMAAISVYVVESSCREPMAPVRQANEVTLLLQEVAAGVHGDPA